MSLRFYYAFIFSGLVCIVLLLTDYFVCFKKSTSSSSDIGLA